MQFGVFTVGDVTPDPTPGTPSARKSASGSWYRRAQGRRDRPRRLRDRRAPQRAVRPLLPDHAARLHRREDGAPAAVDRDDTDHDQRPGQDRRGLRDAPAPGRRPGRPDDGSRQHGSGLPLVRAGPAQRDPAGDRELRPTAPPVARGRRRLGRQVPDAADRVHLDAAAARRRAAVRLARLHPQPGDRGAGRVLRRRLLPQQHLLAEQPRAADGRPLPAAVRALRPRAGEPGHRRARRARVHAQEQPGRDPRVPAVLRPRAGLRRRDVARGLHGPDADDHRQPAAGHRPDARFPRVRRRLPAPAVPGRPRRPPAHDGPRADGHPGLRGRAGPAPGVRGAPSGGRAGRAAAPSAGGRRAGGGRPASSPCRGGAA